MRHRVRLVCWTLDRDLAGMVAEGAGGELLDHDGPAVVVLEVDARAGDAAVRKARKALDAAAKKLDVEVGDVLPIAED